MRKYRDYTDEDVINLSAQVTSLSQLLKELDLKQAGGNFANMKRILQRLDVDTSHWTGKAWNKGQRLKDWSEYTRTAPMKKHLIVERGNVCESCGRSEWMGKEIKLELHHLDGDRTHNQPENLKLMCPNCHSMTDNWRVPNHSHVD